MNTIEALVGHFDTGRLITLGNQIIKNGGIAGDLHDVTEKIKAANPTEVNLYGEMLPYCVRFAVEDLLSWEVNGIKPLSQLVVNLINCRGPGSSEQQSGGFNPTQEQLQQRFIQLTARLDEKFINDPRLIITPTINCPTIFIKHLS